MTSSQSLASLVVAVFVTGTLGAPAPHVRTMQPPQDTEKTVAAKYQPAVGNAAIGTHNSYHISPSPLTLAVMGMLGLGETAAKIGYTHDTLGQQSAAGLTTFEIDVYADPDGGLFKSPLLAAAPLGVLLEQLKMPVPGDLTSEMLAAPLENFNTSSPDFQTIMKRKGFKVFHVPVVDFQSRCLTLQICIGQLLALSRTETIQVLLEIKDKKPDLPLPPHMVPTPLKMTNALWAALEDEVQGAVSASPPIKFLIDSEIHSKEYMAYVLTKADKTPVLTPNIKESPPWLDMYDPTKLHNKDVYLKCNGVMGACAFGKNASQLVQEGFLVRARSDDFPLWDEAFAKMTLVSGAQLIHTDYPAKLKQLQEGQAKCASCEDGIWENGHTHTCADIRQHANGGKDNWISVGGLDAKFSCTHFACAPSYNCPL